MYYKYNNIVYKSDRDLVLAIANDTGIQYQKNIVDLWSDAELLEIGITKIIPQLRPDDAIYIIGDLNIDGTWQTTLRDTAQAETMIKNRLEAAVQMHLDEVAQTNGYDNINSIAKYQGYANTFQVEAEALGAWCANCWSTAFTIMTEVQAGTRTIPTSDELIALLPVYNG